MKRLIIFAFLAAVISTFSTAQTQYRNPDLAWGLAVGAAHGSDVSGDRWGMQYRAFFQFNIVSPLLLGQINGQYVELSAQNVYSANTAIVDGRVLFSPFTLSNMNPYLYGGAGITKRLNTSGSDYLPMVMIGAGIQTKLTVGTILNLDGGYNLSLSDDFDGQDRSLTNLNAFTNQKQDGYYGFTIGVAFTIGSSSYTIE
jgi:hypothetical protein